MGIIFLFTVLLVIRWQTLPVFLDIYYHTSCMAGFREAGGVVLHDFWEYAPAGRPHLYPPLFPIIMLGLNKLGLPALSVMRLVSVAIYPALLITILWVVTKLYNDRCAFFTVLAASVSYTFFINIIAAIPSAIALIILVLIFYAIEVKRTLCGMLLMGLLFYTHGALPWISVLTIVSYSIFRKESRGPVFLIILGGVFLGSPWLFHMVANKAYFLPVNSYINRYFEANICLYIFAAIGIFIALRRKGRYLFYPAMLVCMALVIRHYAFRFLCGEGLLPVIFLAGIGLDGFYGKAAAFLKERTRSAAYTVLLPWLIFYFALLYSPVIYHNEKGFSFTAAGSAFSKFVNYDPKKAGGFGSAIYAEKYMEELFAIIRSSTRPDEIVYSNYNYVSGIFYVFCGRAASSGMLSEVKPVYSSNPVLLATLVVWIKNPEGVFDPELKLLIDKLGLIKVAETEIAYVYRNPVIIAHKIVARPVISSAMVFAILFAWIAVIFLSAIL